MSACLNNRRRTVSINSPIPSDDDDVNDLDPTEVVFNANLVTSTTSSIKDWRPMSSVSQPERSNKSGLEDIEDKEPNDGIREQPRNSPSTSRSQGSSGTSAQSRRSVKTDISHQKSHRHSYTPGRKSSKGGHKSFITMDQRKRMTIEGIKDSERNRSNAYGDRVCRPYSTYSVSKSCERLAISPYGGPILPGAAGRYREHYQSRNPPKLSKETLDALNSKFQKFYINLDLVAITENKKPAGTLKRPPAPKTAKKGERQQNSLHHGASERMNAVQTTLGWQQKPSEGKRFGVGYHVAMELSHNLETHRKARSANVVPEVPPYYITQRSDTSRLNNQSLEYLTQGEISIRQSLKSNSYDSEKPKREPTKFVKKRPPSPPLSKLSRDKFLPEALRRREEMENSRSFSGHSGLRLGKTTGVFEDSVSRAESAGNSKHRGLTRSSSDDATLLVRSESRTSEQSTDEMSEDKKLVIRGQSAKHTPRGEPSGGNGLTTPRSSPEPLLSRTIEQKSAQEGQDKMDISEEPGIQNNTTDNDDKATSVQGQTDDLPSYSSERTNHDYGTDDGHSYNRTNSLTSSMTSFKSLDVTLPPLDEAADCADIEEDVGLSGNNNDEEHKTPEDD